MEGCLRWGRPHLNRGLFSWSGSATAYLGTLAGQDRAGNCQVLGNTCHLVMGQVRASHLASYKGKLSKPLASGSFRPGLMLDRRGRRVYTCVPCYWLSVTSQSGSQLGSAALPSGRNPT